MDTTNPIVLLNANVWHIVESGRASDVALCGLPLRQRRAHSRLRTIGRDNVCPDCLHVMERESKDYADYADSEK